MAEDARTNGKTAKAGADKGAEEIADDRRAYAVLRPLKHDGRLHLPAADGSVQVRLSEAEAAEMKALGAVGDAPAKAAEAAG